MSIRGGYKIIDLSEYPLPIGDYVTVTGIYEKVHKSNKPVILENVTISAGDGSFNDYIGTVILVSSTPLQTQQDYIIGGGKYRLSISSTDEIYVFSVTLTPTLSIDENTLEITDNELTVKSIE